MKLSRLFVLSTFGLMSLNVSAAGSEDLIEREQPTPESVAETAVAFEVGKTYILYNTGAQMYFTQGSTWSTRGCVVPNKVSAVPIRVAKYTIDDVWDGKTYEIQNYVTNRSAYSWYKACMNEGYDLYLDQLTWANRFYEIQDQGSNVYRLMPNDVNEAVKSDGTQFVGYDGKVYDSGNDSYVFENGDNAERVPLTALTTENVDWVFYEYTAWDANEKAAELKSVIVQAEAKGIDVTNAVNVYNDESSTVAQIEAALKALQEEMASGIDQGTADNPSDATSLIQNPNFDDASSAGWSGSSPNMVGSGSHGPANVAEFYQGSNIDMYQELGGLPNGVYCLQMYGLYRSGNAGPAYENYINGENYRAKLYATADGEMLTTDIVNPFEIQNTESFAGETDWGVNAGESNESGFYIPNDPSCARVYFNRGWYKNTLFFYVSDGTARVGVREDGSYISGDWFPFDEFTLNYYGNTEASFGKWVELSAPSFDDAMITASLLESYKGSIATLVASAKDKASAVAAVEQIKELVAPLKANAALWTQWLAALDGAVQYTTGDYGNLNAAAVLGEYISFDSEEQKNNPTWDDATIQAEIDKIAQMIQDVINEKMQNITIGEDVTDMYIGKDDAEFVNGKGGWTLDGNCNFGAGGAEAYNQKFDLYKEIASVNAAGVYELKLNGFFRLQRDQAAYNMYINNEQVSTYAWIYMNDVKSYVKCVFTEAVPSGMFPNGDSAADGQYWVDGNTDNWYPNTMTSAVECFDHDMYQAKAYGLVANAGDPLRIGIAGDMTQADGPSGKGANWMMWDKFKLTFLGYEANTIAPILQEALANFPSLEDPMGKDVYAKATQLKTEAEAAVYGSDGKKMFEALKGIWEITAEIENSVALFKKLKEANEGLNELISSSSNEEAGGKAGEFYETVSANIAQNAYNDDEVEGLLKEIKGLRYMLRMPVEIVAGTDLTNVLENPEYSNDEGAATSEGWEGTTVGLNSEVMNAEIFNTETFDHYQEIPGLPEGTYEVTVKAYYRAGNAAEDYAALQENKDGCDNALLYANAWTQTLHRLAEFAADTHAGEDGWAEVAENSGLYVPNSMSTADTFFDEQGDAVVNTVKAFVKEGETLRLGLKKEVGITNDWCLFDNWTLKYVSKENTAGEVSLKGDVNGDGAVNVADISAIISVMAGEAQEYAPAADVNGDGSVNVADISSVIDIMAAMARAAKAIEE